MKLKKVLCMAVATFSMAMGCMLTNVGNVEAADYWVYSDDTEAIYIDTDSVYTTGNKFCPDIHFSAKWVGNNGEINYQGNYKFSPCAKTEMLYYKDNGSWKSLYTKDESPIAHAMWYNYIINYAPFH